MFACVVVTGETTQQKYIKLDLIHRCGWIGLIGVSTSMEWKDGTEQRQGGSRRHVVTSRRRQCLPLKFREIARDRFVAPLQCRNGPLSMLK